MGLGDEYLHPRCDAGRLSSRRWHLLYDAQNFTTATWAGAKYSLNAVGNNGNPIADTIFPIGFDPISVGMIPVPEPGTAPAPARQRPPATGKP